MGHQEMASLQQLLAAEGFKHKKFLKSRRSVKLEDVIRPEEPVTPSNAGHDWISFGSSKQKSEEASSSRNGSLNRVISDGETSNSKSISMADEPALDDAAIKSVVSILSGYIGRYLKDDGFREMLKGKCNSCLIARTKESDNEILANIELGIESIDRLFLDDQRTKTELRMKSMRNSIQLLSIVASLNSKESRNGSTCGVPNSHLSACAQLYLSIVYKIEKNDRISARHLLQVFCDSPFLARTHLLPDLWEHFFFPHLLHLKIWYHEELEALSRSPRGDKEKRMRAFSKVYSDQMDMGTIKFALYYKGWIKVGGNAPSIPSLPLPSRPSYLRSRRTSMDSFTSNSSNNRNLYRAVFGPSLERRSLGLDLQTKVSTGISDGLMTDGNRHCKYVIKNTRTNHRRHSSQHYRTMSNESWPLSPALKFLSCHINLSECLANGNLMVKGTPSNKEESSNPPPDDLSRAISTTNKSDSLADCEDSIRTISKAWLDSHGDPAIESALSKTPVIKGMMEVLLTSKDDEILELTISMLAEFAAGKDANRLIVLNSDPQLEIFLRLLKSNGLFLKTAVLLYLLKPRAKQMISNEWVALSLQVLKFGDQPQTLFTVRCMPGKAAIYLLHQLLTGFSEDKNLENANQLVSLGGLSLLVKSFVIEDVKERDKVALLMSCCIRANASSRSYLACNVNQSRLLELIVYGMQHKSKGHALDLISELLCLSRRTQVTKFLIGLRNGWDGLNTMHIFLAHLQRASPKDRLLVAAILLHLDTLGDPLKFSLFREEAIEVIIEALDCQKSNSKVQEQLARVLLMLGGCFSCRGETYAEDWLLHQTGLPETFMNPLFGKERVDENLNEEEAATEDWQRKMALVLLNSGGKRFLNALSYSIANGIPSLAQACLSTVAWMNKILLSVPDVNVQSMIHSVLVPKLQESLHCGGPIKDVIKNPECVSLLSTLDKDFGRPYPESIVT